MAFISKSDILAYIDPAELDQLIDNEDTGLDRPIEDALGRVRGKIQNRYNVDTIFAAPTEPKYANIRKIAVDICIFYLYNRVAVRHIPDNVVEAYKEANQDLYDIATGEWDSQLPKRTLDDSDDKHSGQGTGIYDDFIPTQVY